MFFTRAMTQPGTLMFKDEKAQQVVMTFDHYRDAIIAAIEQLTPEQLRSAFLCGEKSIVNDVEIVQIYGAMIAKIEQGRRQIADAA